MDESYLNVREGYVDDCSITGMQYHSFLSYSSTAMSCNDEIKISIQNMDAYTLPCESYIFIEGKVIKPSTPGLLRSVNFSNNGLAFLFSEIRYEVNGTEIQKLKTPGIASCLKSYCSYSHRDLYELQNASWDIDMDVNHNKEFMPGDKFSACLPLKCLFGFCEDYKKILLNCNQQLILNRASTDHDALRVTGGGTNTNTNLKKLSVELS
ncbi:Hypothetical protein CINCED_3A005128 [Cinara cedri]|uniref:Double jelly roll-like domain-containing protein n=1 Tax=Cinara cedri TaxID=506608 RepID=A0A5E4NMS1_9HEMI|nr:Hypothetical protein CINCED_3A005128 [Cinara cedri]